MPDLPASGLRRRQLLQGVTVGAAVSAAGCTGLLDGDDQSGDDREVRPTYLTATGSAASDLHLYHVTDRHSDARVTSLLDGAYTLDTNGEFYSLWVEEIENIDDEEYVYTLRDNLNWSEEYGRMTADDWVFHYHAVIEDALNGDNWAAHPAVDDWRPVESVEADDERTFTITLERPDPLWIQTPALRDEKIYPAALVRPYYESWQDGDDDAGTHLAEDNEVLNFTYTGNLGPYTFEERDPGNRWVASRNDAYYRRGQAPDAELWADAPYFEEHRIHVIADPEERLAELEAAQLTGLDRTSPIPPDEVPRVSDWDHVNTYSVPSPYVSITAYNQRANGWEPFRNRAVRRAFSMVIDKEMVTSDFYQGTAEPAQTFQPEWSDYYVDDEVEPFGVGESYDPSEARAILEDELPEHGYEFDGDTLVDEEGEPVELGLVHRDRHRAEAATGRYHAEQYEEHLGIAIDRETVPSQALFDEYIDQEDEDGRFLPNAGDRDTYTSRRAWDIMWSLGLNTWPLTPDQLTTYWGADAAYNFMGWEPPADVEIDEMVAGAMGDPAALQDVLAEVFGILSREQPANFLLFADDVTGYHEALQISETETEHGWGYLEPTWWATEDVPE